VNDNEETAARDRPAEAGQTPAADLRRWHRENVQVPRTLYGRRSGPPGFDDKTFAFKTGGNRERTPTGKTFEPATHEKTAALEER
jgi:hypothetical protein